MRIGMIMKADRSTTGKDEEGKRDEEGISGSDDLIRLCETLRLRALWTSRGFPKIGVKGVKIHSLHVRQEGSSVLLSHLIAIPITTQRSQELETTRVERHSHRRVTTAYESPIQSDLSANIFTSRSPGVSRAI
jgi:hypothetical protein